MKKSKAVEPAGCYLCVLPICKYQRRDVSSEYPEMVKQVRDMLSDSENRFICVGENDIQTHPVRWSAMTMGGFMKI